MSRRTGLLRPAWRLLLSTDNGERDITSDISGRLNRLSIRDARGIESDELQLELDDADNQLDIPPPGARLSVAIGWHGQALIGKGIYTVDEPEYSNPPRQLRVTARAADVSGPLGEKRDRSWHDVTLRSVAASIAEQHGLTLRINTALADTKLAHIDQTTESDIAFLSRVAADYYDAICTVKSGHLLLTPAATCEAVSGQALTPFLLRESDCSNWRWSNPDRDRKTAVRAFWHDVDSGQRRSVQVGTLAGGRQILRTTYPSEEAARQAAQAELRRLARGGELQVDLPQGAPELIPETPVTVSGFKPLIDDTAWVVKQVTHTISGGGMTCSVEMEARDET